MRSSLVPLSMLYTKVGVLCFSVQTWPGTTETAFGDSSLAVVIFFVLYFAGFSLYAMA